jgi:hypothetical protein
MNTLGCGFYWSEILDGGHGVQSFNIAPCEKKVLKKYSSETTETF